MSSIPDHSIDMILCDLPYGTTACKWDTVIPFEPLWEQYKRLIKPNGAIVLTASQPFTTSLIASNMAMFKYCWVWEKQKPTNFLQARKMPLRAHEEIAVFYQQLPTYNPQGLKPVNIKSGRKNKSARGVYGQCKGEDYVQKEGNFPRSVLKFDTDTSNPHPTAKPVALFEYLIKTYTQPGEIVLDNCIGSGTTAVAALNTGRFFIGIEKEPTYCNIARKRVEAAQSQQSLFG